MTTNPSGKIFYGWWVVAAAFLNFFFIVGIIFYGFPVFYSSFVESLGFTRSQVTQGFFLGFLIVGLPFGLVAGAMIDRIGAKWVIVVGTAFVGMSLLLMARMTKLWQYEALCVLEVLGYVFAGPIATQVLVSRWFRARRGRAMGIAYLGLGSGGVVAPLLVNYLIRAYGWRHALEIIAIALMAVLFPVGIWVTRSTPEESGLLSDGETNSGLSGDPLDTRDSSRVAEVVGTKNFWLILLGSTLAIGAIGRRFLAAATAATRQALDCRDAIYELERRSRAGILRRRHGRGGHHRTQPHSLVIRDRAQFELHLQGPRHRYKANRARTGCALRARRLGTQSRRAGADHGATDRSGN
jgi:MFS family permease